MTNRATGMVHYSEICTPYVAYSKSSTRKFIQEIRKWEHLTFFEFLSFVAFLDFGDLTIKLEGYGFQIMGLISHLWDLFQEMFIQNRIIKESLKTSQICKTLQKIYIKISNSFKTEVFIVPVLVRA